MSLDPTPPARHGRRPLTGADSFWLRLDHPTNLMVINGVMIFPEPVDFARLRVMVEERLVSIERFRQRVAIPRRGRPHWEVDPQFDLDRHLTRERLPDPGGDAELRDFVSARMSGPLDHAHPPWRFTLVENYRGGAALMGRLHHCIGDGIALMLVLLSMTDRRPEEGTGDNPFTALFQRTEMGLAKARGLAEEIMPEGMRLLTKPIEMFRRLGPVKRGAGSVAALARLTFCRPDSRGMFKGDLGVAKRVAWSAAIPLEEVREMIAGLGGTINDLLLTAMAGGIRRYVEGRGGEPDQVKFRATVPVNLRALDRMADLGNEFGLVYLPIPVNIADPRRRLAELQRRMSRLKRSAESLATLKVLTLLGRTPHRVQRQLVKLFAAKATAVMTNVPGPRETLYLAGQPISDIFFWVPQSGPLSMGISILSYAGKVRLGVSTDAGLVPDPERIVDGFHEELAVMRELAAGA